MEFRILGPLEVRDGDRVVEIAGTKRRAVLALLLLHANEVVRTDRLIDELWGENVPRNAAAALHSHVSRLRKALGSDVLARREWGYVLRTKPESIDLHRFEQLVARAEPLAAVERSAKLADALKVWRGPALADLANEPGLQTEIARLDELRLTTLERRIDADLEAGPRTAELVGELESLIAAHPLREHLRWQLILALYRAGRQAEALEVYRETRRVLTEELGLEPSPALRELETAILRQDPAISAASPMPVPAGTERSKRHLPLLPVAALLLLVLGGGGLAYALVTHGRSQAAAATAVRVGAFQVRARSAHPAHGHVSPRRRRVNRTRPARHEVTTIGHSAEHGVVRRHTVTSTPVRGPAHTAVKTKVATKTTPKRVVSQKPRIVTISDGFDGNGIDGTVWYQIYQGSGWAMSQHDGHLEFVFPSGTAPGGQWNNYGGHLGTQCTFPGNFDARVDFTLVQWPAANSIVVSLWAFFKPNNIGWASTRSSTPQWGEQYGAYLGQGHGGSVSLNEMSGTLRLTRRNGLVSAYFLHKGKWYSFGSAYDSSPTVIAVGAGSVQNPPIRSDQAVVDFDNFTVTGANPICPPGSDP